MPRTLISGRGGAMPATHLPDAKVRLQPAIRIVDAGNGDQTLKLSAMLKAYEEAPVTPSDGSLLPHSPAPTLNSKLRASTSVPIWAAPLSTLIRDPLVRRAFERAEREDGTAPAIVAREPRKPLRGGAEARREAEHA